MSIDYRKILDQKEKLDEITQQSPGEVFRLPKGTILTAIDPINLELPKELFSDDKNLGSIIDGDEDMEVGFPQGSECIIFSLKPGMSLTIKKSTEALLFAPKNEEHPAEYEEVTPTSQHTIPRRVVHGSINSKNEKACRVRVRWKLLETN